MLRIKTFLSSAVLLAIVCVGAVLWLFTAAAELCLEAFFNFARGDHDSRA